MPLKEHLKKPLLKIHEITRIQLKYMILKDLFGKVIIFPYLRKYRMATAVNFDKYSVIRKFERTSIQNT